MTSVNNNLYKYLIEDIKEVSVKIEPIIQISNQDVEDLIEIYQSDHKLDSFFQHLLETEINLTPGSDTLFRRNSVPMKVVSIFLKNEGTKHVISLLEGIFNDMIKDDKEYEIDPSKMENLDPIEANTVEIISLVRKFLETIFASKDKLPDSIKQLLFFIKKATEQKFQDMGVQSIAGFYFLRLLNPAIVSPVEFGVLKEYPKKNVMRGLILASKILQNIANRSINVNKEPYMKAIEPFVNEMIKPTFEFLDAISSDIKFEYKKSIDIDIIQITMSRLYNFLKSYPISDRIKLEIRMNESIKELDKALANPKVLNLFLQYSSKLGKLDGYLMLISIYQFKNGIQTDIETIIKNLKKDTQIESYKLNQLDVFLSDPHREMFDDVIPNFVEHLRFYDFLQTEEYKSLMEPKSPTSDTTSPPSGTPRDKSPRGEGSITPTKETLSLSAPNTPRSPRLNNVITKVFSFSGLFEKKKSFTQMIVPESPLIKIEEDLNIENPSSILQEIFLNRNVLPLKIMKKCDKKENLLYKAFYGESLMETDLKAGKEYLTNLVKQNQPWTRQDLVAVGLAHLRLGNFKSSLENLNKVDDIPFAQILLGHIYRKGLGVEKDVKKAFNFYKFASDKGYFEAKNNLANCYLKGEGVEEDIQKGIQYLEESISLGSSEAYYSLAQCYLLGVGVEKNEQKAYDYFLKSSNYCKSQFKIGHCFDNGIGTKKDHKVALKWYHSSADEGNYDEACLFLGNYYLSLKSDEKAFHYFQKGAEKGNSDCLFYLAQCYQNGSGVTGSSEKAVYYFNLSIQNVNDHEK